MNVTRATFDDVMVPNYNPAGMVPVRVKVHAYGIKMELSTSTLQAVLQLTF